MENVDGGAETRDWTYVHKDGSTSLVAVTLTAVRDALGQHIGYLAVGRDVTEQREAQRLLEATLEKERQAAERLRDLDRAKNDFVSTISHELRTGSPASSATPRCSRTGSPARCPPTRTGSSTRSAATASA